jgi:hypothetical protein
MSGHLCLLAESSVRPQASVDTVVVYVFGADRVIDIWMADNTHVEINGSLTVSVFTYKLTH